MSRSLQRCVVGGCLLSRRLRVHVAACPVLVDTGLRRRALWDKKFVWDVDLQLKMYDRYDISVEGWKAHKSKKYRKEIREDQEFREARFKVLGPDLAAATFITARNGRAKFQHEDIWIRKAASGNIPLPNKYVEGFHLEGIDASGTELMLNGMDNFVDLEHLKYLNLSNLVYINDWFMTRLHRYSTTLEFLDISNNPAITDEGLAALYKLTNLKGLNITNCSGLKNAEAVCVFLEDCIPDLIVIGMDTVPQLEGDFRVREIENSRFLNLGKMVDISDSMLESGVTDESDITSDNVSEVDVKQTLDSLTDTATGRYTGTETESQQVEEESDSDNVKKVVNR